MGLYPIIGGTNNIKIAIVSNTAFLNTISEVCVTYIILYIPSFHNRIHSILDATWFHQGSSIPMVTSLSLVSNYTPLFRNCLFGFLWVRLYPDNMSAMTELVDNQNGSIFMAQISSTFA